MYTISKLKYILVMVLCFFCIKNTTAQDLPIIRTGDEVVLGVGKIRASDLSQDGSLLAIGTNEDVFLYDLQTEEFLPFQNEFSDQSITSLAISPNNEFLFTGFEKIHFNNPLAVYLNIRSRETINVTEGHSPCEGRVPALKPAFLNDGQRLVVPTNTTCFDLLWEPFKENTRFSPNVRGIGLFFVKAVSSPDSKYVAMIPFANFLSIVDVDNIQNSKSIREVTQANSAAFSPDSSLLAEGEKDGDILFIEVETSEIKEKLSFEGVVTALAFTPDWQTLVAGNDKGQLAAWDMNTLQRQDLMDLKLPIQQIRATEKGVFAVAQNSAKLEVWNVFENQQVFAFPIVPNITHFEYMPDGKSAIIQQGGQTELWDTEKWIRLRTLPDSFQRIAQTFADGDQAWGVTGISNRQMDVLDLETGEIINQLDFNPIVESGDGFGFDLSGNGKRIVTVVRKAEDENEVKEDGFEFEIQIRRWDIFTGEELNSITRLVNRVDFELSFDGSTLLFRDDEQQPFLAGIFTFKLLDLETEELLQQFIIDDPRRVIFPSISDLLFSPNGQYALTGVSASKEDPAKFFLTDTSTGELVHTLYLNSFRLESPRFSPDSKYLISRGQRLFQLGHNTFTSFPPEIILWDLASGEVIGKFRDDGTPEFSPDGSKIVTRSDVIRIKDLATFIDQNTSHVPGYLHYK